MTMLTNPTDRSVEASQRLVSISDVVQIILRRWAWGASLGIVVATFFLFVLLSREKQFEAVASVTVNLNTDNVMDIREVVDTELPHASLLDSFMNTQIERIKARSLGQAVVAALNPEELAALRAPFVADADLLADTVAVDSVELIHKHMLKVETGEGMESLVIRVRIVHRDAAIAALLANTYIDEFIAYNAGFRNVSTRNAVNFLGAQIETMRAQLAEEESSLQNFRVANNLVTVEPGQGAGVLQMRRFGDALTDARIRLLDAENKVRQIQECDGDLARLMDVPFIGGRREVMAAFNQLSELKREYKVLEEVYLSKHPLMVQNQASQKSVEEALQQLTGLACKQVESEFESIQLEVSELAKNFVNAEQMVLNWERAFVEYQRLEDDVDNQRKIIKMLAERYNETSIAQKMDLHSVRVLDRAQPPTQPVSASIVQLGAVAVCIAAAFFVAVPVGLELVDNRLSSFADVELYTGKPILGDVRYYPGKTERTLSQAVLKRDSDLIEPFRALYARVRLQSDEKQTKHHNTLVVTSSVPGEGKSMVAGNLASAFAMHQHRVLLVDCDLRRPSLQATFAKKQKKQGLIPWYQAARSDTSKINADLLTDPQLGIVAVSEQFFFLGSGGQSDCSTEILSSTKIAHLFAKLKDSFDVVIFDTPPVGLFPDACLVADNADECLFVARQFKATRNKVRYSIAAMDHSNAAVLGVVLNGVKNVPAAIGYGPRSRSYYGYGVEKDVRKYTQYYGGS